MDNIVNRGYEELEWEPVSQKLFGGRAGSGRKKFFLIILLPSK